MIKVLIVENEPIIAELLAENLGEAGYEVCGIASTVAQAIEIGTRDKPDLGVINVHLSGGEYGTEIAATLRRRRAFGVLYATGNPLHPRLIDAEGEGCISKPYLACNIVSALRIVTEQMSNRPLPAFPRGFRLLSSSSTLHAA